MGKKPKKQQTQKKPEEKKSRTETALPADLSKHQEDTKESTSDRHEQNDPISNQQQIRIRKQEANQKFIKDLKKILNSTETFTPKEEAEEEISDCDEEKSSNFTKELFRYITNLNIYHLKNQIQTQNIRKRFKDTPEYIHQFLPNFINEITEFIDSSLEKIYIDTYCQVVIKPEFKKGFIFMDPVRKYEWDFLKLMGELIEGTLMLVMPVDPKSLPNKFSKWRKMKVKASLMVFQGTKDYTNVSLKCNKIGCPNLKVDSKYFLIPLENLTTFLREGEILAKINRMPLINYIIDPVPAKIGNIPDKLTEYFNNLGRKFNHYQCKAIIEACSLKRGFYLLQGPPGTGKTQVIIGLMSGFMIKKAPINPKILVCAPSNVAINGCIQRFFKIGILNDLASTKCRANILRIGSLHSELPSFVQKERGRDNLSEEIKDIDLKTQVNRRLKEMNLPTKIDIKVLMQEINELQVKLERVENKKKIEKINEQLGKLIEELKEKLLLYRESAKIRKDISMALIHAADIVFCTLSSASNPNLLDACIEFDYVIIDEICQSIELSSLLALQHRCKVAVLIGDPQQLPATTFANSATNNLYNRSLFERLVDCGLQYETLNIQYRMTAEICEFPSGSFYKGRLVPHKTVAERKTPEWIIPPRLLFIDLKESQEQFEFNGTSPFNMMEAHVAIYLLSLAISQNSEIKSIGVISPYKKQVELIKLLIEERFGTDSEILSEIEVRTVDGFQGREKDLIILSCVRTSKIGFLNDHRRMNVAITRAKFGLWIIGNRNLLASRPSMWQKLIQYHLDRNSFVDFNSLSLVFSQNSREIEGLETQNEDSSASQAPHLQEISAAINTITKEQEENKETNENIPNKRKKKQKNKNPSKLEEEKETRLTERIPKENKNQNTKPEISKKERKNKNASKLEEEKKMKMIEKIPEGKKDQNDRPAEDSKNKPKIEGNSKTEVDNETKPTERTSEENKSQNDGTAGISKKKLKNREYFKRIWRFQKKNKWVKKNKDQ